MKGTPTLCSKGRLLFIALFTSALFCVCARSVITRESVSAMNKTEIIRMVVSPLIELSTSLDSARFLEQADDGCFPSAFRIGHCGRAVFGFCVYIRATGQQHLYNFGIAAFRE